MSKLAALKKLPLETVELPLPEGGPWNLQRSQAYCLDMALQEPQNNQLAYWYLGRHMRPHVATVYAFAHSLHLAANQPNHEELLMAWESAVIETFHGKAKHPVLVALQETAEKFDMPVTPFTDLLIGARMMATQKRFARFSMLLTYVEKIAHPLGRIVLQLAGDNDADHIRASDDICTGMALNAFWTYLGQDFAAGRLHLPEEDMQRFGVSEADITQQRVTLALRALLEFQVSRTRMYLMRGRPLCSHLPDSLQNELQMLWFGVDVALDKIESKGCEVFKHDMTLSPTDWMRATVRLGRWRMKGLMQW